MTIKQILIGTLVGTSILAVMVHRTPSLKSLPAHPRAAATPKLARHEHLQPQKVARLHHKKTPWLRKKNKGSSNSQLSSRKLYGE